VQRVDAGEVAPVGQKGEFARVGAVGGGGEHQRQHGDAARRREAPTAAGGAPSPSTAMR
jgi:hypothetical protein